MIEIKEYLCLISTNVNLDENEIIRTLESRESNDTRSLGELFLHFSDEMADITWIQAFQMLLQMFRTILTDYTELSDEKNNAISRYIYGYITSYVENETASCIK